MQLIHAQHQARTLAKSTGYPVAVIEDKRDFMPISLDQCDTEKLDPCFIAYPSGKSEVVYNVN